MKIVRSNELHFNIKFTNSNINIRIIKSMYRYLQCIYSYYEELFALEIIYLIKESSETLVLRR